MAAISLDDLLVSVQAQPDDDLSSHDPEVLARCDCRRMCVKKCPCKSSNVKCTDACGCGRSKPCRNRPCVDTIAAAAGATSTGAICTGSAAGTGDGEDLQSISSFVISLDTSQLQTLCTRLLSESMGGVT